MEEGKGWLRTHWRTAVILIVIFSVALFFRLYFVYGLAFNTQPGDCAANYEPPYSGGSDSFYWDRALCYSTQTGKDLGTDCMLNYPVCTSNPRPPLFPWFSLLVGRLFAPLFGNVWNSVLFVFLLSTGFFGSLTIFPTYALGKEAFGRKAGLIGAFLLAISVGHLQRSSSTDADHDAFTLFFVVSTFYFFLRSMKTMKARRWVDNWFRREAISTGVRAFFKENRKSVLYALLAGLCVAVIALAWQGWAYVSVILLVWFVVELFLDRFRNQDTMGTWILFTIALATPLILAFQWYWTRNQIRVWYDVPAYLFLASIVLGLAFSVTRDYPWTLVVPATLIAAAIGLVVGVTVNPVFASALVSGAGYFVQSKVVSTIAEDQSPGMSQLILSFGWFTFYMSLAAIAFLVWQIPRRRDPAYNLVVIWAFAAIFMAITAARFIFNASPAFAITAGFAIDLLLARADFATMRRTYRSLAGGSWRNALRKSVKLRHVVTVVLLVFLVLLPNIWFGVDAAIPFELKTKYDQQVANLLPTFLRAPGYSSTSGQPFYFGAFGYSLPKATDYYPAAWSWFRTQDGNQPPELRPAFLSWWDYGFEAVDRGLHPTVADNFQAGVQVAAQFITAQNETEGIALLSIRLLEGHYWQNHRDLSPAVRAALESYDLRPSTFTTAFSRPQDLVSLVLSDPVTYGPWAADMNPLNAEYIYLTHYITSRFNEEQCAELYHAIRATTGRNIGYFAVDSRLFPISDTNTGIFYAPVKLADHRVIQLADGRVLPFEYFQILANTTRGTDIPIQFVAPGDQIQSERIEYQPAFYNSMFYRAYIGYTPTDLGLPTNKGIPGFDQVLRAAPPVPAWNLTHWRVVYRTAYYNPFTDVSNHTDAYRAVNYDEAAHLQSQIQAGTITGVVDRSTQASVANGVVFLRYYDGAWVNGTVRSGSQPIPGVRITVTDELGTPHYVTTTDDQGHYSALVPFGTITITASVGNVAPTTLIGSRTLATFTIPVTIDQAMRVPADLNGDSVPDWLMTRDLQVTSHIAKGTVYFDLNRNGVFDNGDAVLPGATVTFTDAEFHYNRTGTSAADGSVAIDSLIEGSYGVAVRANGRTLQAASVNIAVTDAIHDISIPFVRLRGYATSSGAAVGGAAVEILDETNGTTILLTTQSDGSYSVQPLMAGNYTITASSGDLASSPARTLSLHTDIWYNLTLVPSGVVAGATTLFGTDRPFASLQFQSATNPRFVRTATSDAGAQYSIRLPAGEWFVTGRFYDGVALYATFGEVLVATGGTGTYDAMFVQGVRVNGTVSGPGATAQTPGATVAFSNGAGQLWLTADASGRYLAFLPAGTYNLEAFENAAAVFTSVPLTAGRPVNIQLLATSETVPWFVYRDANGNGVADAGEGIAGAHVTLTDDRGAHVALTTNATGQFQIPLFANRTYVGVVGALGYASRAINAASPATLRALMPIALAPIPVGVLGSLILNGSAILNRQLRVQAVAVGNGAVSQSALADTNGGYGMTLVPGTYDLIVDENVSTTRSSKYQNLGFDRIVVPVAATALAHDVPIVVRNLVIGNVTRGGFAESAALTFDGPEHRTVNATASGFEIYLIPGPYSVSGNRTIAQDVYAFVTSVTVPPSGNLTFALTKATLVTGHALVDGVPVPGPMPVTFVRQEGGLIRVSTDPTGTYIAHLVAGNYTVTLAGANNATQGNVSRYYRYAFSGSATVPSGATNLTLDLFPTRSFDNTTLLGTVRLGGTGVDAIVNFYARGGGAIAASASAGPSGSYAVSLAPGTYDVYATRGFGGDAFLARISIPHAGSVVRDIPLRNGFILAGVTTDPHGFGTSASITVLSQAELELTSTASGAYSAVLPSGTYTVTAMKAGTENGIAVTYRATASVVLNADTIANLALAKVVVRSAALSWDASQRREIAAGDSVTYAIVVRNTGSVADTMSLSGQPTSWEFSFAPASVSLNFGNVANRSVVQVTITSPASALVNHEPITIVATSTTDGSALGSVGVVIDIVRTRGLALTFDPTTAVFDGHFLNYTLAIKNSGNDAETVNVGITNPNDLAALGWTVRLRTSTGAGGNLTLTRISIPANSTTNVRVQAQSPSGPSGATVVVQVSSQDSMAVSATGIFPLLLPQLGSGGISVGGPDVARQAPLNYQLVAVVAGAVAAIAAGLYLTRRRR